MANQNKNNGWFHLFLLIFLLLFIVFGLNPFGVYAYEDDYEYEEPYKVEKKYFSFGNSGGIDLELPIMSFWSTCDVYLPSVEDRRAFINSYNNQILNYYNSSPVSSNGTGITSIPTDHLTESFHYVVTYDYVSDYVGSGNELRYFDSEGTQYSLSSDYENKVYMLCIYGIVDETTRPYFFSDNYTAQTYPNYLGYSSNSSGNYSSYSGGYKLYWYTEFNNSTFPPSSFFYEFYISVDGRNWYIPCTYYLNSANTSISLISGCSYISGKGTYYGPIYCGWEDNASSNSIQIYTKGSPTVVYSDFDIIGLSSSSSDTTHDFYDYKCCGYYAYKILGAIPLPEENLNSGTSGDSGDSGDSGTTDCTHIDEDNDGLCDACGASMDSGTTDDNPIDDETDESIFKKALRAVFGNFIDTFDALFDACTSIFDLIKTLWDLVINKLTNGDLNFALPYYFFTLARAGVTILVLLIVIKFLK